MIIHAPQKVVKVKENNVAHPRAWVKFEWVEGKPQIAHILTSDDYKYPLPLLPVHQPGTHQYQVVSLSFHLEL